MRVYKQNHNVTSFSDANDTDTNIFATSETPLDDPKNAYPTFTLSTEVCIYVHSILMASLFIIGIARYYFEYIISEHSIIINRLHALFEFQDRVDSMPFVFGRHKISIMQCSTALFQHRCDFSIPIHRAEY